MHLAVCESVCVCLCACAALPFMLNEYSLFGGLSVGRMSRAEAAPRRRFVGVLSGLFGSPPAARRLHRRGEGGLALCLRLLREEPKAFQIGYAPQRVTSLSETLNPLQSSHRRPENQPHHATSHPRADVDDVGRPEGLRQRAAQAAEHEAQRALGLRGAATRPGTARALDEAGNKGIARRVQGLAVVCSSN